MELKHTFGAIEMEFLESDHKKFLRQARTEGIVGDDGTRYRIDIPESVSRSLIEQLIQYARGEAGTLRKCHFGQKGFPVWRFTWRTTRNALGVTIKVKARQEWTLETFFRGNTTTRIKLA